LAVTSPWHDFYRRSARSSDVGFVDRVKQQLPGVKPHGGCHLLDLGDVNGDSRGSEYVISCLDPGYTQTLLARRKRDCAWIMARTPEISEAAIRGGRRASEGDGLQRLETAEGATGAASE
jgi:hypothetical protein